MTVKPFKGSGGCGHPHEYAQIKEIYNLLSDFYQDQTIYMITNLRVNNGEIDCLLLRHNGPVILELKAYCGKILGTENDKTWYVTTKEGKKVDLKCNLFTKLGYYRYDIIDKIHDKVLSLIPDIDQKRIRNVSAWGYFEQKSVYPADQVNMRASKWFNIVTGENLIEQLEVINSGYELNDVDLENIVQEFHVEPWIIPRTSLDTSKGVDTPKVDKKEKPIIPEQPIPKERLVPQQIPVRPSSPPLPGEFIDFDKIWDNIVKLSGETFRTREGFEFTYKIDNSVLLTSLQGWGGIPRSDFEMACAFGVCKKPKCYGSLFAGGKLIWTILHDSRINS
jgi:hypothetical protein